VLPPTLQHPARLVPLAFLLAIALGTGLLMLPAARAGEGAAPFLTALFTATSAVCVTGLIVQDTPAY
jgi:trk system potassium uptake protein TrkH